MKESDRECSACHTSQTPKWRKTLCNACSLYAKMHGIQRPARAIARSSLRAHVRSSLRAHSAKEVDAANALTGMGSELEQGAAAVDDQHAAVVAMPTAAAPVVQQSEQCMHAVSGVMAIASSLD